MKRALAGLALLAVLALVGSSGALLVAAARRVGTSQGYAPAQPIAFSHRLHAGRYRVPCQYCHFAAERSRHAGIPPLAVCRNCHAHLQVASAEVEKLKEALAQRRAVSWVRIHSLPDFVAFRHDRHLLAGLACRECHGPVETMARVRQTAPLTMGWCLGCHRQRAARAAGGGAAGEGEGRAVARSGAPGGGAVLAAHGGSHAPVPGLDCARCHY